MRRHAVALAILVATFAAHPALAQQGRELTPEVRAMLFGAPQQVVLRSRRAVIRLEGTDYRGFYRCTYMRAYVNGRGPFTFLLDTGAGYTTVTHKVAEAAGAQLVFDRGGRRDIFRLHSVRIGDAEVRDLWVVADDDWGVDGVLGFNVFGRMNLLFELKQHRLIVTPDRIALPHSFELSYTPVFGLPTVPFRAGSVTVQTLIDTGDDAYAWEARRQDLPGIAFVHPPVAAQSVRNGPNVQETAFTTLAEPVHFGPLTIEEPAIGINDDLPVADVGIDFLENFNFAFDVGRRTVTFQPLNDPIHIRGNLSLGFSMRFDRTGAVSAVVPGSPANGAGIQEGDTIVTLGGADAKTYTPRTWDALMVSGKVISVHWTHEGAPHEGAFAVTELR